MMLMADTGGLGNSYVPQPEPLRTAPVPQRHSSSNTIGSGGTAAMHRRVMIGGGRDRERAQGTTVVGGAGAQHGMRSASAASAASRQQRMVRIGGGGGGYDEFDEHQQQYDGQHQHQQSFDSVPPMRSSTPPPPGAAGSYRSGSAVSSSQQQQQRRRSGGGGGGGVPEFSTADGHVRSYYRLDGFTKEQQQQMLQQQQQQGQQGQQEQPQGGRRSSSGGGPYSFAPSGGGGGGSGSTSVGNAASRRQARKSSSNSNHTTANAAAAGSLQHRPSSSNSRAKSPSPQAVSAAGDASVTVDPHQLMEERIAATAAVGRQRRVGGNTNNVRSRSSLLSTQRTNSRSNKQPQQQQQQVAGKTGGSVGPLGSGRSPSTSLITVEGAQGWVGGDDNVSTGAGAVAIQNSSELQQLSNQSLAVGPNSYQNVSGSSATCHHVCTSACTHSLRDIQEAVLLGAKLRTAQDRLSTAERANDELFTEVERLSTELKSTLEVLVEAEKKLSERSAEAEEALQEAHNKNAFFLEKIEQFSDEHGVYESKVDHLDRFNATLRQEVNELEQERDTEFFPRISVLQTENTQLKQRIAQLEDELLSKNRTGDDEDGESSDAVAKLQQRHQFELDSLKRSNRELQDALRDKDKMHRKAKEEFEASMNAMGRYAGSNSAGAITAGGGAGGAHFLMLSSSAAAAAPSASPRPSSTQQQEQQATTTTHTAAPVRTQQLKESINAASYSQERSLPKFAAPPQ